MKQTSKIPFVIGFVMCLAMVVITLATSPMPEWMTWIEARLFSLVWACVAAYCTWNFTTLQVKVDGKLNKSLLWWAGCWIVLAQIMVSFYIADK